MVNLARGLRQVRRNVCKVRLKRSKEVGVQCRDKIIVKLFLGLLSKGSPRK